MNYSDFDEEIPAFLISKKLKRYKTKTLKRYTQSILIPYSGLNFYLK